MSYIRCLSNPEGLYIYSSSEGVQIHHCLRYPMATEGTGHLDNTITIKEEKDFFRACHLWDHGPHAWHGPVKVGKLSLQEVHIFERTAKKVPKDWDHVDRKNWKAKTRFSVCLQYGKHYIMLWRVTWQYVVANVVKRSSPRCRYCPKLRKAKLR